MDGIEKTMVVAEKYWDKIVDYSGYLLQAIIVLIAGIIITKALLKLLRKGLEKSVLDPSVHKFILQVARYGLYVLLVVLILSCLKIPTAPLVTVLGACGAALALALQGSLSNVASGIMILFKKPFKRGDYIVVAGFEGTIESIEISTTTIITADNRKVIIPNSTITGSVIINTSAEDRRRVDLTFGISYDADIEEARKAVLRVCGELETVHGDPKPFIGVSSHGDSAVLLDLRCWVDTPDYLATKYRINEAVKNEFDKCGIGIPYPQVDVHMINQ